MVSGMDRYYQIARCFRDEDLRADRQPEFSQIDIEQSFMDEEAFFPILETMIAKLWKEILGVDVPTPFPRMPYAEAMNRFGSDKPDVRFGLELNDLSEIFKASGFQVFQGALEAERSRKDAAPSARSSFRARPRNSRARISTIWRRTRQATAAKGLALDQGPGRRRASVAGGEVLQRRREIRARKQLKLKARRSRSHRRRRRATRSSTTRSARFA